MISIGSLIGSFIGYRFGGVFGLFFFGYLGFQAETWIAENIFGRRSRKQRIQESYFKALFTSIGKLAKADGVVTKDEIRKCEAVIQKMQLNSSQRDKAIKLFNIGKEANSDINPYLQSFIRESGRSFIIKQMFMEAMIEVAIAENNINQAELNFMISLCQALHFPENIFIALLRMRGFNVGTGGHRQQSHQNRQQQWQRKPTTSPYQILGVSNNDSKVVIRKAYKKLMSQHHPDKLIAKGLPPEMIEIAKKKTQNIQAAWEEVKDLRGF